jgi:uncharacterized protein
MKKVFEITDKKLITEMLNTAEYGVLALCGEKPYAVPVNFVYLDGSVYFHGSPKGKKMSILEENNRVSFNVTTDATIIPSYFSSTENIACPASTFFKSIIIDGETEIISNRKELARVFLALMEKLQPEGKYKSFESSEYNKQFAALSVVKINTHRISARFKFGQNLNKERFKMVVDHLENRGRKIDLLTADTMKQFYSKLG